MTRILDKNLTFTNELNKDKYLDKSGMPSFSFMKNGVLFDVYRKNRKTLGLFISHRKVEVRVPRYTSKKEVSDFVFSHRVWVAKCLDDEKKRNSERLRFKDGGVIFFRARELRIVFKESRLSKVKIDGNQFIIHGHALNKAKAEEIVKGYLIAKAKSYMVLRTMSIAKHLGLGLKITDIKFRKTKTKWGHCTSKGVLQFNWLIMLAPLGVIDYMISHEVCHLRYMNHSSKFWEMVESICPRSNDYALWLKKNEHRLSF